MLDFWNKRVSNVKEHILVWRYSTKKIQLVKEVLILMSNLLTVLMKGVHVVYGVIPALM